MKGTLTEDPEIKKAHQEKDVMTLMKLLKNINFNYKRSDATISTPWQANKDSINLKQQKMKVVEDLNHTAHGYAVVKIMCSGENKSK